MNSRESAWSDSSQGSFPEVPALFGGCDEQQSPDASSLSHQEVSGLSSDFISGDHSLSGKWGKVPEKSSASLSFANNYQTRT